MVQVKLSETLERAAEEFNRRQGRRDGALAVQWLDQGLTVLRNSLYLRMHQDVERFVGRDSMLTPVSEIKAMFLANQAIETYQIAESAAAAKQFNYLFDPQDWYLPWLAELRLGEDCWCGETAERTKSYFEKTVEDRRRAFIDEMARILHQSAAAPLVLFRLIMPAVQIVTAQAFGDRNTAINLRLQQVALLPSINDCQCCHGKVLDKSEQCAKCGNPLWRYEWLTAAD